ncbi:NAD(P)H-dependent flavin oxidoreductase [Ornithinimicrobium cavernae]|uniref:NAD(P)H-dependent flavin oxidoreductase n=1 Tax=Ornithinimicrobium cavernae TaxID=2666047 RepID=UPI001F26A5D4|nr:nitronate monooxygenase family protein [Ornithinimicrobium cavernae]
MTVEAADKETMVQPLDLRELLLERLRIPLIGAPMFLVSGVDLVVAQSSNGVLGTFPSKNARTAADLVDWLDEIGQRLGESPFGVNLVAHASNDRYEGDARICVDMKVPVIVTSLAPAPDLVAEVHAYGGAVLHDVTTVRHAEKALEAGVDGLVLVCAGAGGHGGKLTPFAFVPEVRQFYSGPLVVGGGVGTGGGVLAARALGADGVYVGTRFIPTAESLAVPEYKDMVIGSQAKDVAYTPYFSGVPANYLVPSIVRAGLDVGEVIAARSRAFVSGSRHTVKAWKDIWGAGQGVGHSDGVHSAAEIIDQIATEYDTSRGVL